MSGVYIRPYHVQAGRRYQVRYRAGGRCHEIQHLGSFASLKEAQARRDFALLELAAGRDPRATLRQREQEALEAARARLTVREWWDRWEDSRADVRASTLQNWSTHRKKLDRLVGHRYPDDITPDDIQELVGKLAKLHPASVRLYLGTLAQVLDYAGALPNPVRARRVRLRRVERPVPAPPSAAHVQTILDNVPAKYRLPLRLAEQAGMRIGEVLALQWQDVDEPACRIRVRQGKTPSARRLLEVPDWLMADIAGLRAREDRQPERLLFGGMSRDAIASAMRRACTLAGIPHYSPHDLRHRYASLMAKRGVPRTDLAAQLGHANTSLLPVYEHVIIDE